METMTISITSVFPDLALDGAVLRRERRVDAAIHAEALSNAARRVLGGPGGVLIVTYYQYDYYYYYYYYS